MAPSDAVSSCNAPGIDVAAGVPTADLHPRRWGQRRYKKPRRTRKVGLAEISTVGYRLAPTALFSFSLEPTPQDPIFRLSEVLKGLANLRETLCCHRARRSGCARRFSALLEHLSQIISEKRIERPHFGVGLGSIRVPRVVFGVSPNRVLPSRRSGSCRTGRVRSQTLRRCRTFQNLSMRTVLIGANLCQSVDPSVIL